VDTLKWKRLAIAAGCLGILGLALTAFLNGSAEEIKGMNTGDVELSPTHWIPPIDASAPARTETATFSLG